MPKPPSCALLSSWDNRTGGCGGFKKRRGSCPEAPPPERHRAWGWDLPCTTWLLLGTQRWKAPCFIIHHRLYVAWGHEGGGQIQGLFLLV